MPDFEPAKIIGNLDKKEKDRWLKRSSRVKRNGGSSLPLSSSGSCARRAQNGPSPANTTTTRTAARTAAPPVATSCSVRKPSMTRDRAGLASGRRCQRPTSRPSGTPATVWYGPKSCVIGAVPTWATCSKMVPGRQVFVIASIPPPSSLWTKRARKRGPSDRLAQTGSPGPRPVVGRCPRGGICLKSSAFAFCAHGSGVHADAPGIERGFKRRASGRCARDRRCCSGGHPDSDLCAGLILGT